MCKGVIMKNCGHQCYNCARFEVYYTCNCVHFQKTKVGYCRANKTNVNIHDCCEKFIFERRSSCRNDSLINARLNRLLTEIGILRALIEEDRK